MADQDTPDKAPPLRVVICDTNGKILGSFPVTIGDNGNAVEGATTDAAVITDTTGTLSGKLRGLVKWAFERMPASLGQKAMSASLPVVLASDQASVPVAATLGAETTKVIGTVNQGTTPWNVGGSNGAYLQQTAGPNNLLKVEPWSAAAQLIGQKTMAGSLPVVLASDQASIPVAATLTAETTKVIGTARVIGNAGAVFDAATAAAVPANALLAGGTDGTNLRGVQTTSAANLTGTTTLGALLAAGPLATWSITHRPAAATKATATKGAGAAGVRHVCTGFSFNLATVGTAQAALLNCDVIDGASAGTTRLASFSIGGIPVNSQVTINITGCMLIGTAATAMTIEFDAAGVAASVERVNLQGFSVS